MLLSAGARVGPYEILSPIGVGGMGEVYRARDSKLNREVALKILPSVFALDSDRLQRFDREARLLAALNHLHIGAIYGFEEADGVRALVLELVEGETLAEWLRRGPVPVAEALRIAEQICDALDAAHERGIVHRDLKPANIKITPDGVVKVLDFGLAKAGDAPALDLTHSPTMIGPTGQGMLLGTAPYMSPEQARGKAVDKRGDIWAFGCVLYEMLTGLRAFRGETSSDAIAGILEREPDWASLPAATPQGVQRLLRRCLEKDPKRRLHDIADARIELNDALGMSASVLSATIDALGTEKQSRARHGPSASVRWALGLVVVGAAAGAVVWTLAQWRVRTGARPITKSVIELPSGMRLSNTAAVAISPDGRTVVFAAQSANQDSTRESGSDRSQLYLRAMDRLTASPIPGTEGGANPAISPDGQWVAFDTDGRIKKVALSGGATQVVCDTLGSVTFVEWLGNDTILFTPSTGSGLWQVPANGGTPKILTDPGRDRREKTHRGPEVLPGGKAVIMTVGTADISSFDDARIEGLTLATGARRVLLQGGMNARYVSTGHLIYARAGSLLAVPFDADRLEVTGQPIAVVDDVFMDPDAGHANFAFSRDGSLVYAPGGAERLNKAALVWVDRQGGIEPAATIRGPFEQLQLSPDGERVAVMVNHATADIWIYDLRRTTFTRLVYGWDNNWPVWSADGAQMTFITNRLGGWKMFSQPTDGSGAPEPVTTNVSAVQYPESWSPDGKYLVFRLLETPRRGDWDLWVWSVKDRKARALLQTPASESQARISPDGHWIAYTSDQAGHDEVYVQAFPDPSRKWQVSPDGGWCPIWAKNGRELFYRKGNQMMAVDVSTTGAFAAGRPKRLFEGSYVDDVLSYDVARDGRFLMIKNEPLPVTHLIVAQNWFDELRQRARVP